MDNAYQKKLQDRAEALAKKDYLNLTDGNSESWEEHKLEWAEEYKNLAALTLEWSAADIAETVSTWRYEDADKYLLTNGFVPPKTDKNETDKDNGR